MVKPMNLRMGLRWLGLLLLLLCLTIVSCAKKRADPPKSISYMRIANLMYASPSYIDSVEVGIVVNGQLSMNEACWVGLWDLSQGYSSQPVWCASKLYARSCKLVFYPFLRSEGIYGLKAGLCDYSSDECVDTSATDHEGPLTIAVGASYWPRVITIEYDCQRNYNILSGNTLTQLNAAFNPCSTAVKIVKDDTLLADEAIASYTDLIRYVMQHRNTTFYKMYLLGILDESPRPSNHTDALGLTFGLENPVGEPNGATVIFKRCIDSTFSNPPFWWNGATLNIATDLAMTHELGHQRANLTHADSITAINHVNGFPCAMKAKLQIIGNYELDPSFDRFCDSCVARVKRVSW